MSMHTHVATCMLSVTPWHFSKQTRHMAGNAVCGNAVGSCFSIRIEIWCCLCSLLLEPLLRNEGEADTGMISKKFWHTETIYGATYWFFSVWIDRTPLWQWHILSANSFFSRDTDCVENGYFCRANEQTDRMLLEHRLVSFMRMPPVVTWGLKFRRAPCLV
jgi:hypothetical protein